MSDTLRTQTKKIVTSMLKENTGAHILDSGGAYGRHWEQNQKIDLDVQPQVWANYSVYNNSLEICATISLYHWMNTCLRYDAELQEKFDALVEQYPDNTPWLQIMENYAEKNFSRYFTVCNTYNEPDSWDLSQVIQFIHNDDGDDSLILQVHNGCDVRGGYTAPRCFTIVSENWLEHARITNIYTAEDSWSYDWNLRSPPDYASTEFTGIEDILQLPAYKQEQQTDEPYLLVEDSKSLWLVIAGTKHKVYVGNMEFSS